MRAVVVRSYGGPEALEVVELPAPEPRRGQVRIRVEAAAVNPVDIATREGLMNVARPGVIRNHEHVGIGWDVAGTAEAVGPDVTAFGPGDRVIGLRDRLDQPLGTYAEQVVLDAADVAPAPAGVDPAAASTIPLNTLTTVQALDALGLAAGQTILVTGAGGGLGGFGAELAAMRGLRVIAAAGDGDAGLGKLTLRVAAAYPLEEAARAHERLQAGGLRGRLVLVP